LDKRGRGSIKKGKKGEKIKVYLAFGGKGWSVQSIPPTTCRETRTKKIGIEKKGRGEKIKPLFGTGGKKKGRKELSSCPIHLSRRKKGETNRGESSSARRKEKKKRGGKQAGYIFFKKKKKKRGEREKEPKKI